MASHHMNVNMHFLIGFVLAILTVERFLASVNPHVGFEVTSLDGTEGAHAASVGPFAAVPPIVPHQETLVPGPVVAEVARIWF